MLCAVSYNLHIYICMLPGKSHHLKSCTHTLTRYMIVMQTKLNAGFIYNYNTYMYLTCLFPVLDEHGCFIKQFDTLYS